MKKLKEYINEEIINEEKIYSDNEIIIIQGWHSDDRLDRRNYKKIDNKEIISTLIKSKNRILKLFIDNKVKDNDEFVIIDKSYKPKLNIICIIKNTDKLIFTIKTQIKKDEFKPKENDNIIELY